MKSYRAWDPGQGHLLPPSPLDWLPDDHLVHFLLEVVSELDLSAIEDAIQAKDHRGRRPYPPRMMVALLLYGYCVGVMSSRKLEAATYEHVGFRVLCAENHPDHATIANFRKTFLDELSGLFVQVLKPREHTPNTSGIWQPKPPPRPRKLTRKTGNTSGSAQQGPRGKPERAPPERSTRQTTESRALPRTSIVCPRQRRRRTTGAR